MVLWLCISCTRGSMAPAAAMAARASSPVLFSLARVSNSAAALSWTRTSPSRRSATSRAASSCVGLSAAFTGCSDEGAADKGATTGAAAGVGSGAAWVPSGDAAEHCEQAAPMILAAIWHVAGNSPGRLATWRPAPSQLGLDGPRPRRNRLGLGRKSPGGGRRSARAPSQQRWALPLGVHSWCSRLARALPCCTCQGIGAPPR